MIRYLKKYVVPIIIGSFLLKTCFSIVDPLAKGALIDKVSATILVYWLVALAIRHIPGPELNIWFWTRQPNSTDSLDISKHISPESVVIEVEKGSFISIITTLAVAFIATPLIYIKSKLIFFPAIVLYLGVNHAFNLFISRKDLAPRLILNSIGIAAPAFGMIEWKRISSIQFRLGSENDPSCIEIFVLDSFEPIAKLNFDVLDITQKELKTTIERFSRRNIFLP